MRYSKGRVMGVTGGADGAAVLLREGVDGIMAAHHDVFISYSSKDKPTADAVCARLEAGGLRCWIAPRDVLPSLPYGEAIIGALHQSRLMVLVFSGSANRSPQVMREVERAVSRSIPILPFRIEDVPLSPSMEYFISAPHWLDAMTPPLEPHLERLVAAARAIIRSGPPAETTAPPPAPPAPGRRRSPAPIAAAGTLLLALLLGGAWGLSHYWNRNDARGRRTPPAASSDGCLARHLRDVPQDRIVVMEEGAKDAPVIGPRQPKDQMAAIRFTENGRPLGAITFRFYPGSSLFKIASVIDAACRPVEAYFNATRRGSDKNVLHNWDDLQVRFGDAEYSVNLEYVEGRIDADFRRISPTSPP